MKKKYVKPELITQDFSMQIFLQNCYSANNKPGNVDYVCWYHTMGCSPCTYPNPVNLSNMKPHP